MQLIEQKPPLKALFKRLLIAAGVDILIFAVLLICLNPTPDDSIIEILLLWGIFLTNICLAIATRYTIKKLYAVFLINSFCASLIFHLMFNAWLVFVK
jgi:hypothetical protein